MYLLRNVPNFAVGAMAGMIHFGVISLFAASLVAVLLWFLGVQPAPGSEGLLHSLVAFAGIAWIGAFLSYFLCGYATVRYAKLTQDFDMDAIGHPFEKEWKPRYKMAIQELELYGKAWSWRMTKSCSLVAALISLVSGAFIYLGLDNESAQEFNFLQLYKAEEIELKSYASFVLALGVWLLVVLICLPIMHARFLRETLKDTNKRTTT